MLVFEERGKPEHPEKNLSEQRREPTNSVHIWRRVRESNPGHIGGRRALSPLRQPCSPKPLFVYAVPGMALFPDFGFLEYWLLRTGNKFLNPKWLLQRKQLSNHQISITRQSTRRKYHGEKPIDGWKPVPYSEMPLAIGKSTNFGFIFLVYSYTFCPKFDFSIK